MRYELAGAGHCTAVIDDSGVRITTKKGSRFTPLEKIVSISVRKPGLLTTGHIFFQTAADSNNPLASLNTVQFTGKDSYELACEIKAEVEKTI